MWPKKEFMKESRVIAACLVIIIVFLAGVVLKLAKPVLFPFFLAIFLAFLLFPILDFLTRLKIPKSVAVLVIVILTFLVIYLLGLLFYTSGRSFASEFPKYGQKISSILTDIQERIRISFPDWEPVNWVEQLNINKIPKCQQFS